MCILDALILNTDRHSGNFGVLYDNDTMKVQRMAPVFDNNRSLLFDLDSEQLRQTEWCIRHCAPRSVRISSPRPGASDSIVIRSESENREGVPIGTHPSILLEAERLDRLNTIVQFQLDKILA